MLTHRLAVASRRFASTMAQSKSPMEDIIRAKLVESLKPSTLLIYNDSHLHSHHKAMQGVSSKETHFRVVITSEKFHGVKLQAARHRMIYALLKDEMAQDGGIHALQLKTRTPEEEKRDT